MPVNSEKQIKSILKSSKKIAVVGISNKIYRPSYGVSKYMLNTGYQIFPVNPKLTTVLDQKCYPNLSAIGQTIDIVNIFRRPDQILPIIEEAIQIGAKTIWMQLGVVNLNAARIAEKTGLQVVMDMCIRIEHNMINNW